MVRINGKVVEASVELVFSPTGVVLITVSDYSNGITLDLVMPAGSERERVQIAQAASFYRTAAREIGETFPS